MSTEFLDDNTDNPTEKVGKNRSKTPVLDNFSSDLTNLVKEGKIDEVIGRDVEIKRMVQILSRKKKRNVIVVGEPGTGKSALAEKLALIIENGNCPHELLDKRVVSLDLTSIVAGTKFRGQFEERMKAIINEVKTVKNVILFIDEIHTMMGAGNGSGNMDAANILKPALARGEIQVVGATTLDEYKKHLEKDGALERRFGKIILHETNKEETIQILKKIKHNYEDFHNVTYSDEVITTIVNLTDQYITDRFFPDKALDVLDDLGSEKKMGTEIPLAIEILNNELATITKRKIEVVKNQEYAIAAQLKREETEIEEKLVLEKEKWKKDLNLNKNVITIDDVHNIMTSITGIPINKTDDKEVEKLINFEKLLSEKVVGQKEAITSISKAIRRNRVGVKDKNRPQFSGMFLGESGTGKTYLTKTLAEILFGSSDKIIRLDMSEYMDKHNVSKLIGSPPGFVGYEEGGQLTEKVKNNPFSILLFDEIEKAHKDVFNLLLQVLDEGHLTDSFGRKVNFKNTVIIMTSNIGAKQASEFGNGLGFSTSNTDLNANKKAIINKELKKAFAPEFLNRIDDIVMFDRLNDDEIKQIISLEVKNLTKRLTENNYNVIFDESVIEEISKKNREEGYGARPIKRIIQNMCEDFIADEILKGTIKENTKVYIKFKENLIISKRK